MTRPQCWDNGELDALELGERVADCLFAENLSAVYPSAGDRTRSMVLHLFGFVTVAADDAGREVPDDWRPTFDKYGRWQLP